MSSPAIENPALPTPQTLTPTTTHNQPLRPTTSPDSPQGQHAVAAPADARPASAVGLSAAASPATSRQPTPSIVVHTSEPAKRLEPPASALRPASPTASTSTGASPRGRSVVAEEVLSGWSRTRPATATGASTTGTQGLFLPIMTQIPTGSLDDLLPAPEKMQFSNRGSIIMVGGERWRSGGDGAASIGGGSSTGGGLEPSSPLRSPVVPRGRVAVPAVNTRVLSVDEASLSARLRSMYEHGCEEGAFTGETLVEEEEEEEEEHNQEEAEVATAQEEDKGELAARQAEEDVATTQLDESLESSTGAEATVDRTLLHSPPLRQTLSRASSRRENDGLPRQPYEAAGGIEDWEDVRAEEIDRYGFIVARPMASRDSRGSHASGGTTETPTAATATAATTPGGFHRVAGALLEASAAPRRRGILRRAPSRRRSIARGSSAPTEGGGGGGGPSRQASRRSLRQPGSVYSNRSNRSVSNSQSSLRSNLSSKERRLLVDASDMLTLPPAMAAAAAAAEPSAENTKAGSQALLLRKKEWEREGKWKKMGRLRPGFKMGGGMQFDFDVRDPKVISRTWKGIPDRWRATAWYSFLEASAKQHADAPTEESLVATFHELQQDNSADDVQIDCDVPRTISQHIMFRRRYRGGQRLLFRVLHALSLHFPEVGYVQGMAALAATLLCYYDEEHTFVMMVRLWQLRGLQRLYESGFDGLMDALGDWETHWLRDGAVAKKLEELGIHSTAYATRWYLTLFNYSIPFPAQLRVWDVFMLLGDASQSCDPENSFGADLDVLHATSAALVDATREILLGADFEDAMKVLTSWIPVQDEELLMRVANAEWKQRKKRGRKSAA